MTTPLEGHLKQHRRGSIGVLSVIVAAIPLYRVQMSCNRVHLVIHEKRLAVEGNWNIHQNDYVYKSHIYFHSWNPICSYFSFYFLVTGVEWGIIWIQSVVRVLKTRCEQRIEIFSSQQNMCLYLRLCAKLHLIRWQKEHAIKYTCINIRQDTKFESKRNASIFSP